MIFTDLDYVFASNHENLWFRRKAKPASQSQMQRKQSMERLEQHSATQIIEYPIPL